MMIQTNFLMKYQKDKFMKIPNKKIPNSKWIFYFFLFLIVYYVFIFNNYFNTIIHDMLCFVFEEYVQISDSRKLSGRIGLHVSIEHYNITVCKFKEFLPSCEIHDLDSFKLGILPLFGKTKKHDDVFLF